MGFGRGPLKYGGDAAEAEAEDDTIPGVREPKVLGARRASSTRGSRWDQEPLATIRAEPRRFLIGVPIVMLVAAAAGAAFMTVGFEVALCVMLITQALGCIALYVPALRKRTDPMRNPLPRRDDASPIDLELAAARGGGPDLTGDADANAGAASDSGPAPPERGPAR